MLSQRSAVQELPETQERKKEGLKEVAARDTRFSGDRVPLVVTHRHIPALAPLAAFRQQYKPSII